MDTPLTSADPLYATFPRRLKAFVVDELVVAAFVISSVTLLGSFENASAVTRTGLIATAGVFFVFYEPICVSLFGRTLGHRATNLCVVTDSGATRLPLWKAFLRSIVKIFTGVTAFATMPATSRNQALHDLLFGTTVQIFEPRRARAIHYVTERPAAPSGPMPSRLHRLGVVVLYLVLVYVWVSTITLIIVTQKCIDGGACSGVEEIWKSVLLLVWPGASFLVAVLGWQGRLWGGRRTSPRAI
jgi:uncharacterized RDD family membrane protein YckC